MRGRGIAALIAGVSLALAPGAFAQDERAGQNDYGGFRNVLPGGQGQTINGVDLAANQVTGDPPSTFTSQLSMYTDLLKATPTLSAADLDRYFKREGFGVSSGDVDSTVSPRPGVTIVRDRQFGVPHVYGETRSDTMFGAGYASGQDRLFFMDVLRHTGRARLTELIGPGEKDSTVKMDAEQLKIADYSEQELQAMIDTARRDAGPEGEVVYQDLLDYVAGINAYIDEARLDPTKMPGEYPALGKTVEDWKPTDTVAVASLIGGIFGRGGGSEALAAQALRAAQERFGVRRARAVFRDFRAENDPEAPVTTQRRFPFDNPGKLNRKSIAAIDVGSYKDRNPVVSGGGGSGSSSQGPGWLERLQRDGLAFPKAQSNALLVNRSRSASGRPVAVMGPQVGYYSPQVLMEIDMHGPGVDARGASFPGISLYVLLGRGQDFAWSATTATTDVVDEFAERLCDPNGGKPTLDSTRYLYKGSCIPFATRDHVLQTTLNPTDPAPPRTITMKVERSVHGPIQGRATVNGEPVAIAEARSTYFHELDSALAFKRLNSNEVSSPETFQQAMGKINFAFNWFYVDDRDIAYLQSGWFPLRARGTDPALPAWGTGEWDWRGFDPGPYTSQRLGFERLPKEINPQRGYIISWNNKQAPGWRAADDNWVYGSVHRSERLERRVKLELRKKGKLDLRRLTQIMEEGATVDLRGQEVYPWLRRAIGRTSDSEVRQLLGVLNGWRANGSHRRDLDGDNFYDEGAAVALMDAWWERLLPAIYRPVLGERLLDRIRAIADFHQPPGPGGSAFFTGWWGYVEKDLRALLGRRVRGGYSRLYCGGPRSRRNTLRRRRARCGQMLTAALKEAGGDVRQRYGSGDPAAWKVPATCEEGAKPQACDQIEFTTAGAVATKPIPWQDRPTFQQIVEVQGHRPR